MAKYRITTARRISSAAISAGLGTFEAGREVNIPEHALPTARRLGVIAGEPERVPCGGCGGSKEEESGASPTATPSQAASGKAQYDASQRVWVLPDGSTIKGKDNVPSQYL